ncbi:MAG TPA: DNA repair protein RecO [Tenacibaculum sp.]|nr:DNA repair protein RecO [Tenacibaculum sp.]HBI40798.1 DNA repair protein RecO [Tenacibaculum sp.]
MPIVKTKAIVFGAIKYRDTSLIVKCFTLEEGMKTYMVKGVLKSKKGRLKVAYFQPLTQLHIEAGHSHKNILNTIKEAQVIYPYSTLHVSVIKQTIVLFLSDILSNTIKEEEKNMPLYIYIETAMRWLDTNDKVANFHIVFLINISKYLGFYPDMSNIDKIGFDLLEGSFTNKKYQRSGIYDLELVLFKRVLGINFDKLSKLSLNKNERQIVLRTIIKYFELHLDGFRKPKSLSVLETVFN